MNACMTSESQQFTEVIAPLKYESWGLFLKITLVSGSLCNSFLKLSSQQQNT